MVGTRTRLPLLCILVSMVACMESCRYSFAPSAKEMAAADYGLAMTASEMQIFADQKFAAELEGYDPSQTVWGPCGRAWHWCGMLFGGMKYGYSLEAVANAPINAPSIGDRTYTFFFRDGSLLSWRVLGLYRNDHPLTGLVDQPRK